MLEGWVRSVLHRSQNKDPEMFKGTELLISTYFGNAMRNEIQRSSRATFKKSLP